MFSLTPARTTARNDEVREDIILLKTFFLYTSLSHPIPRHFERRKNAP